MFPDVKKKTHLPSMVLLMLRTGKYIYFNRVDVNTPVFMDSAKINRSGKFRFQVRTSDPDFYQLGSPQPIL